MKLLTPMARTLRSASRVSRARYGLSVRWTAGGRGWCRLVRSTTRRAVGISTPLLRAMVSMSPTLPDISGGEPGVGGALPGRGAPGRDSGADLPRLSRLAEGFGEAGVVELVVALHL